MLLNLVNLWFLNCPTSPYLRFWFHKKKPLQYFFIRILAGSAITPIRAFVSFHLREFTDPIIHFQFLKNLITYSNFKINNLFSLSQSGSTGSCDFESADTMATVRGYETLPRNNLESVMNHLANNGPLSVAGKIKMKYCALAPV